jgi:hypothetical protein
MTLMNWLTNKVLKMINQIESMIVEQVESDDQSDSG